MQNHFESCDSGSEQNCTIELKRKEAIQTRIIGETQYENEAKQISFDAPSESCAEESDYNGVCFESKEKKV